MSLQQFLARPDVAALLRENHRTPDSVAQELIVLELYRRGAISGGKAAELLGMERFEFIRYASKLGIAFFDMTGEELDAELQSLDRVAPREPANVMADAA